MATESRRLADMTADALARVVGKRPVILLPLGSHEDHGPHQPMGDYLLADMLAVRIADLAAQRNVPAFVAPALPFGVADYFGSSPGGLALRADTFRRLLLDLLDGLIRHDLTNILILNAHGGNVPVIHEVTLAMKRKAGLAIPSFYLWKIARQLMEARLGAEALGRFGHGAEPLLSLNLALRPDMVVAGEAPSRGADLLGLPVTSFGIVEFKGLSIEAPVEFDHVPCDSIAAAWSRGSAALGEDVAEALVDAGAAFVTHIHAHMAAAR